MAGGADSFGELKQRLRASWMAGDFGEIAKLNVREGEGFIQRINLKPGTKSWTWPAAPEINPFPPPARGQTSSGSTLPPIFWSRPANAPLLKI